MTDEPESKRADTARIDADTADQDGSQTVPAEQSGSFVPRPVLGRGFGAYTHPQMGYPSSNSGYSASPASRKNYSAIPAQAGSPPHISDLQPSSSDKPRKHPLAWLMPWRSREKTAQRLAQTPPLPSVESPFAGTAGPPPNASYPLQNGERRPSRLDGIYPEGRYPNGKFVEGPPEGLPEGPFEGPLTSPTADWNPDLTPDSAPSPAPKFWERQSYAFLAHFFLAGGAVTLAWFVGILVAQILPGRFSAPPLQESFLRKSSRLTHRLWHFPRLWHTPTTQVRIDAIPLPETGPVLGPVVLSPIEKQPLVDELNAIETEILTLDRRLQALEKRLGSPPYQGTGIESRIDTMRTAVDPPVRSVMAPQPYEPIAREPNDALLDVAKLAITLPSDALFSPGEPSLKDTALLERVLDQLVDYPEATISVRVHSDDQVSAIASREYTLAQADTLARYLQRSLPISHRWIPVGMGAAQPAAEGTDAVERQRNRRVEILVDTR